MYRSYKHIYLCKQHFYQDISITPESCTVSLPSHSAFSEVTPYLIFCHPSLVLPFLEFPVKEISNSDKSYTVHRMCMFVWKLRFSRVLLLCLSEVHSFLLLSSIPLSEHTTVFSFFHFLMNTWAATTWTVVKKLLWLNLWNTFCG